MSVVVLIAYHHLQLADNSVGLDDPVDSLGALQD